MCNRLHLDMSNDEDDIINDQNKDLTQEEIEEMTEGFTQADIYLDDLDREFFDEYIRTQDDDILDEDDEDED